ncbi:hypothetical protein D3C71_1053760 [compost metagenome]
MEDLENFHSYILTDHISEIPTQVLPEVSNIKARKAGYRIEVIGYMMPMEISFLHQLWSFILMNPKTMKVAILHLQRTVAITNSRKLNRISIMFLTTQMVITL